MNKTISVFHPSAELYCVTHLNNPIPYYEDINESRCSLTEKNHKKVSWMIHGQHLFILLLAMTYMESIRYSDAILLQSASVSLIYGTLEIRRTYVLKNKISKLSHRNKIRRAHNQLLKRHLS